MGGNQEAWVNEIVFAWSSRSMLGQFGLGPVASSYERPMLAEWTNQLLGRVRVAGARSAPPPSTSLVYDIHGDNAVILRRAGERGGANRSEVCHALVGPASHVTSRLALGLSAWPGWQSERRHSQSWIPQRPVADLWREHDRHAPALTAAARTGDHREALTALVAAAIWDEESPLSMHTLPGVAPEELLWGLLDILEDLFSAVASAAQWTFSTWEDQHHDGVANLPRIVFIPPGAPDSSTYPVSRTIVAYPVDPGNPHAAVAQWLVEAYAAEGPGKLNEALERHGVFRPPTLTDRINALHSLTARSPVRRRLAVPTRPAAPPSPPGPAPAPPSPPEPAAAPLPPHGDIPPVTEPAPRATTAVAATTSPVSPPAVPGTPDRTTAPASAGMGGPASQSDPGPPRSAYRRASAAHPPLPDRAPAARPARRLAAQPFFALLHEPGPEVADRLLGQLEGLAEQSTLADRRAARQLLTERDWVPLLAQIYRPGESGEPDWSAVRHALHALLRYAIGPDLNDDSLDPRSRRELYGQVHWLTNDRQASPHLTLALAEYALARGERDQLLGYLGLRWLREHGLQVSDPPDGLAWERIHTTPWWLALRRRLRRAGNLLAIGVLVGSGATLALVALVLSVIRG
ncbi:MAG TPA: hypothetical protein VFB84_06080 [Micromonosporaceae bacterium]|nr:hypothetical protein [Micromonosporaceae bacterium]